MRMIRRKTALMLALLLALSSAALAESDEPIVVRVGRFSYPLRVVQSSLGSALDVAGLLSGQPITDEDRQAGVEAAIEKFVNLGIIECSAWRTSLPARRSS